MFNSEPPRTAWDLNFMIAGVPVRVHPLFWLVTALLGAGGNPDPKLVLLWVVAIFVSILVHEFGHVLAFSYFGIRSHVVLHSMGGLAIPAADLWGSGGFGRRRRDWMSDVVISLAGPLAGFAFALVLYVAILASGHAAKVEFSLGFIPDPVWEPFPSMAVEVLLRYLMFANIFWGVVNLLPVFPLDGGQVARAVLQRFNPSDGLRQSLILSIAVAALVAVMLYVQMHATFGALFFAFMAYESFQALQGMFGGPRW